MRLAVGRLLPAAPRRRPVAIAVTAAICLAVAGAVVASRNAARPASGAGAASVALARVTQGTLTSQEQVNGTVEYADAYTVANQRAGVYTALPTVGQVIRQGQALYEVDTKPVVLLYGSTPAYRTLYAGMSGPDVAELNADLVTLGLATRAQIPAGSDTFTGATASALDRLQARLGLTPISNLPLGQAVFLPGAVDIGSVAPSVGGAASTGQTVLQTTSTTLEVVAQIDASQQSQVHVGDGATITMPDGGTVPGRVTKVAQSATSTASGSSGSPSGSAPSTSSTVEVDIAPVSAGAFQGLDNAVLDVAITTASVRDALAVPVTALLAQAGGGYAVEVVHADGSHGLVPVQLGIFDDGDGLVQVTGPGLRAGEQVAVAGT